MIPLNQRAIVIFANTLVDEWGRPVNHDNSKTYKVRLDYNSQARFLDDEKGRNIIYNATIYFKGAVPISYEDFIEYDSGTNGIVRKTPKMISPISDLSGKITYTKVIV